MSTIAQWFDSVTDLPRRDCELLFEHVTHWNRATAIADPARIICPNHLRELNTGAQSLKAGEPLAYICGEWEFWGLDLMVNPNVLIPRPETELLVEWVIAHAPPDSTVLDLGTGSGAIAIAIAASRTDLRVTAVDRSEAALDVARQNAERHGVAVVFHLSDWFAQLRGTWQSIVSNPPYVAAQDPHLPALRFEPQQALAAGPDGLRDIRQIITDAGRFLDDQGLIAIEHGYDQAQIVRELLHETGFGEVASHCDLAAIERMTTGVARHER